MNGIIQCVLFCAWLLSLNVMSLKLITLLHLLVVWHFFVVVLHFISFPDSSVSKESACNAGDPGLIPKSGISPGEGIGYPLQHPLPSLVAQLVKNLPAIRETWIWSLGWEDPLWPGEFHGLYSPWGLKESDMTERLSLFHGINIS